MPTKIEKDSVTGTETTGHDWDGIKELNTPLPKWWLYTFFATIAFAIVYCVLYPIPYGFGHTSGMLGYSGRDRVNKEVAVEAATRAGAMSRIATLPYAAIVADPKLYEIAQVSGKSTFAENCQPCHAAGGAGRVGYPALAAGGWIWGGSLEQIQTTLTHGIRSGDPEARNSQMPRFADGVLDARQIDHVANFVWTIYYGHADPKLDVADGAAIFAENCAVCHGPQGGGERALGGPKLASRVHLYGDTREAVLSQIRAPKAGVMPSWNTRLDPATLRSVALYVHSLGGGE